MKQHFWTNTKHKTCASSSLSQEGYENIKFRYEARHISKSSSEFKKYDALNRKLCPNYATTIGKCACGIERE